MVKKKGYRSLNDGKAWKCHCGVVNQPTKHRFFNLPAFQCSHCQRQLKLDFKFCFGEVKANGKSVVGEVRDQEKDPFCVAFAYAKTAEIMERTYNINNGMDPDTVDPINPYALEERFNQKFSNVHSVDFGTLKIGTLKVLHMGLILRSEGIQRSKSEKRYIAADVSTIPRDDFELICHTLAEGIPLVATYWVGKRRSIVGYCKRYKSPPEDRYGEKGAAHIGHAVVLIGAGMKKGKRFFYFLNSWGKKFCPRRNKRGETITGGIGKIADGDLAKNVVRLSHPNESGGERRFEDEPGMAMSNCNYLLMKATTKQSSAEMIRKVREKEKSGKTQAVSFMDYDDGIFSDDEGGYSQTSCAIYQGCGASLGSLLRLGGQWQYQQQSSPVVPSTLAQDHLCAHDRAMNSLKKPMMNHEVADGSISVHDGTELLKTVSLGILRAIRSLNSRPAAIQMLTDQSCTTNRRLLMNQLPVANERAQVNQTPVATWVSQNPAASLVSQTPAANGRHLVSQTPVGNVKTLMNQTSVANGRSLMSQVPAANRKPLMSQIPASNGRPVMSPNGRPQMNQIHVARGQRHTNKIPGPELHPAPLACHAKVSNLKLNIGEGKMKGLAQKLTGSRSRVILKQEEVPTTKVTWTVATKKEVPGLGLLKRATRLLKKWHLRSMHCAAGIQK